jgi:hypothetical protein
VRASRSGNGLTPWLCCCSPWSWVTREAVRARLGAD